MQKKKKKKEYATVVMGQCAARCLHYVTCLHHALKACIQTHNFSYEPIRFCSIRSSTYAISKFWRVNSSSVRKFISNQRESAFYKRIASLLAEKKAEPYSNVMANLRCRLSFALLRASVMCLRGARSTFTAHLTADPVSAEVVVAEAGVARF